MCPDRLNVMGSAGGATPAGEHAGEGGVVLYVVMEEAGRRVRRDQEIAGVGTISWISSNNSPSALSGPIRRGSGRPKKLTVRSPALPIR